MDTNEKKIDLTEFLEEATLKNTKKKLKEARRKIQKLEVKQDKLYNKLVSSMHIDDPDYIIFDYLYNEVRMERVLDCIKKSVYKQD